jgi:hypothetical protein
MLKGLKLQEKKASSVESEMLLICITKNKDLFYYVY